MNSPATYRDPSGHCSTCDLSAFELAENALTVAFTGAVSDEVARQIFRDGWNNPGTALPEVSTLISDAAHITFDVLGFTPIVGFLFDLGNALLYVAEGRAHQAALSAIAAIPGVGDGFALFKPVRYVDDLSEAYRSGKLTFKSFNAFKSTYGNAAEGTQWHHIVEQSQVWRFGAEAIHNVDNVIMVSTDLHRSISGFYSSKQWWTAGLTVREWVQMMPYEQQHQYGLDVMRWFAAHMYRVE
jgi:hypothetical protein